MNLHSITLTFLAVAVAGCASTSDHSDISDGDGPLYAVASSLITPEDTTSYVAIVPSLSAGTEIDYKAVLEVGGGASIFGLDARRFFAVGHDEFPRITRYDVTPEQGFVKGETLDLSNQGLNSLWLDPGLVPLLSETKAYIIDSRNMQVVVWDPSTMLLVGTFSLEEAADADYPNAAFEPDPTLRGSELLVAVTHSAERDEGYVTAPFSTLLVLDTEEDRLVRVSREESCGGLWDSVVDSKGDTYFSTGVWDAAQHRTLGDAISTEPCVVRVKAGETAFDSEYVLRSSELTEGRATGALVSGGGDHAYVKALDEDGLGEIEPGDFDEVWGGAHWRWWRVELGLNGPGIPLTGLPASGAAGGELYADGRAYARNASADFANTTLLDMSQDPPVEQLTLRGFPFGIVRMR